MSSQQSPYDWKFPVKDRELFAGRNDELEIINNEIERLASERSVPPILAIIGERRVGKTSLLLRMEEICKEHSIVPIRVSIEDPLATDSWEFWHEVFSRLLIAANEAGIKIIGKDIGGMGFGYLTPTVQQQRQSTPPALDIDNLWFHRVYRDYPNRSTSPAPATYIIENELKEIVSCFSELGRKGILFIFDEAHRLLDSKPIMQQLRQVIQRISRCGIVFSGESSMERLFNDPNADFFEQANFITLKNFVNQTDIIACSLLPLEESEQSLMSPMTIDHIARLSQGKPNLIRLICDAIYGRYFRGDQKDLNITTDVLDDVIDEVAQEYQDNALRSRIDKIRSLGSVDLEVLYNMTRYPKWSILDIVDLDESFRGEARSDLAIKRRERFLNDKGDYFSQLELISDEQGSLSLIGGEFVHLYVRFLYEVRKYGELSRALVLGKGPPTPFGEKTEKLTRSIAYTLGQSPDLSRFTVHSYYRDEGDIIETVRRRFSSLARIMKGEIIDLENAQEMISECFGVCRLITKPGIFYVLIVSIRNLVNPRENIHIELYFPQDEDKAEIDLFSLIKLVNQQADTARVSLENYGDLIVNLPNLKSLIDKIVGAKLEDFMAMLDPISRWQLSSVQRIVESKQHESEKEEEEEDEKAAKWIELYGSEKKDDARQYIEDQLKKAPKRSRRARLLNDLGYIQSGLRPRQLERARRNLEQAVILHYFGLPLTLMNLAVLDIDQNDFESAIKKIEDVLALTYNIAQVSASYLRLKLPENHLRFRVEWEQHPANVLEAAYINLAYAVLKFNGYTEAHEILKEGQSLIPSSSRLQHALARLYLFNKDAKSAVPIYQGLSELPSLPDPGIDSELKAFSRQLRKTQRSKR